MYRKNNPHQLKFENFYLPFGGHLRSDNRWIILAEQIPWHQIEEAYGELFCDDNGCPAKSARMALGALLIKERLGTSDRETVQQIAENPYLQYFLGLMEYQDAPPFDHSMMTHFRKRFDKEMLKDINESIVDGVIEDTENCDVACSAVKDESPNDNANNPPSNKGKMIVDATCTPADIAYPTDVSLLNEAREKSEEIIDAMHEPFVGVRKKPRTYRNKARKAYLAVAKQKKPGYKKIRKAIGQQLRYLKRNLGHIESMAEEGLLKYLSKRLYRLLLVIKELYRQQLWMYENRTHSISDRIVSLYQPHVRPIVRGKAKSPVEFGAKVSISLVDGFSFVEKIGWDAYNESCDLIEQIEAYHDRFGFYPESVHVDKIYRTQDNRRFCKKHDIRLSGPPLGRPPEQADVLKEQKKLQHQDELDRIAVEGKFGQGKRRFSLARIMTKLAQTSEVSIMIAFILMNLEKILTEIGSFLLFVWYWLSARLWLPRSSLSNMVMADRKTAA
ncbi:MAG: IS5 family transposase [Planctomycetota bacterium]